MGLGQRDLLGLETTRCLAGGSGLAEQDGLAREAQDALRPASGGAHVADLWGSAMPLATDQEVGVGPVAPPRRQQPHHEHGLVGASRARARTQGGRAQRRRCPCEHAERQRAIVLRVRMRARNRLLAIGRVIGGSAGEPKRGWGLCVTGNQGVHEGPREPRAVLPVDVVLQTREGRGTGSIVGRLPGRPLSPECAYGVTAETIGVMGVRIA